MFLKTKIWQRSMGCSLLWCAEQVLSVRAINQRTTVCSNWDYLTLFSTKEQFQKTAYTLLRKSCIQ